MKSDYAFDSRWTVSCSRERLWDVLGQLLDSSDPMVWWPSLQVTSYDGEALAVRARSGLGYALTFTLHDLQTRPPESLTFSAVGDLRGTGAVTFRDLGAQRCAMDIVWRVAVDRRWMRWTGWLLRPAFVAGHHLVMRRGERHLDRWIAAHG